MNSPSSPRPVLLIVDDDENLLRAMRRTTERAGYQVFAVTTAEEGLECLDGHDVDVALIDHNLPRMSGVELISRARQDHPATDYVLFTAVGDADLGFRALRSGADGFLTKPVEHHNLLAQLHRGVQAKRLRAENADLRQAGGEQSPADRLLLGSSRAMVRLKNEIRSFAATNEHILILGESGVGKELCAKALNAESGRRGKFVVRNCGALTASLANLELFGADPGAYSGMADPTRPKLGAFETAQDGMVFLDEIGDLPLEMQVNLLRTLENRTFTRAGGVTELPFRGRVIAATHRNLEEMVAEGTFRKDLFHRFQLTLRMPPLREHREDVELLTWQFLSQISRDHNRAIESVTPEAMACLRNYDWRENNVRELRNALVQAVIRAPGTTIGIAHLPDKVREGGASGPPDPTWPPSPGPRPGPTPPPAPPAGGLHLPAELLAMDHATAKDEAITAFETWYLTHMLDKADWNITHAAELAGVKRPNFYRLMKRYGIGTDDA